MGIFKKSDKFREVNYFYVPWLMVLDGGAMVFGNSTVAIPADFEIDMKAITDNVRNEYQRSTPAAKIKSCMILNLIHTQTRQIEKRAPAEMSNKNPLSP